MLTADHHPCQALADLMTLRETFGALEGLRLAYVGDGNNVARSLAILGAIAGVEVAVASPEGYELEPRRGRELVPTRPRPSPARTPSTPTCGSPWATRRRPARAAPRSRPTGSTTRCSTAPRPTRSRCTACRRTPARRSPPRCSTATRQRIWDQAENRRHAQKALLEWLFAG